MYARYLALVPTRLEAALGQPCSALVTVVTKDTTTVLEQVSLPSGAYLSRVTSGENPGSLRAFDGRDYYHYPGPGHHLLQVTGYPAGLAHDDGSQLVRWAQRVALDGAKAGQLAWGWSRGPVLKVSRADLTVNLHPVTLWPVALQTPAEIMRFSYLPVPQGWQLEFPGDVVVKRVASDLGPRARDEVLIGAGLAVRWPRYWPPGLRMDQLYVCRSRAGTVVILNFSGPSALTVVQSYHPGPLVDLAGETASWGSAQVHLTESGESILATWLSGHLLLAVLSKLELGELMKFVAGLY